MAEPGPQKYPTACTCVSSHCHLSLSLAIEDGSATSDDEQISFRPNIRATSVDVPIQGRRATVGADRVGAEALEAFMVHSCLLSMPVCCVSPTRVYSSNANTGP